MTSSTPHGGGSGAGPVCVAKMLEPFLPVPCVVKQSNHLNGAKTFLNRGASCMPFTVISASWSGLRLHFRLPYDRPCMHECVLTDEHQQVYHVRALDMAKRLMDFGFYPPAIYFSSVVDEAVMIEPSESESKQTLDAFIAAMRTIADEAEQRPQHVQQASHHTRHRRLDETLAVRKPRLHG